MVSYIKPIENLSQFNSSVFKQDTLTQLQASSLYLGRTGTPTSVATTTTFTGSLVGNNGLSITNGTASLQTIQNNGNLNFVNATTSNNSITGLNSIYYDNLLGRKVVLYNSGTASTSYEIGLSDYTLYFNSPSYTNFYSGGIASTPSLSIESALVNITTPIQLQTAYSATPTANQLGFQLSNGTSGFAIASFTTGANTNISAAGIALTPGVWSINYTIDLLVAGGPATVFDQALYVNTNSGAAFTSRIKPCGSTRIHTTFTYATSDTPSFSGAFTHYVSVADTIFPIFKIGFSSGTFSGTGFYVATRVG